MSQEQNQKQNMETINQAKNIWNAVHLLGDKYFEKNLIPGRKYLFLQGMTGSTIVDVANGDTIDEILVGTVGDVVGGAVLDLIPGGYIVNVALTLNGNSVGDNLKELYKYAKTDVNGQYWQYEKNLSVMVGGKIVTYDYARVKTHPDGNYVMDSATRAPVLERIGSTTYNAQQALVKTFQNPDMSNSVQITTNNNDTVYSYKDTNSIVYG